MYEKKSQKVILKIQRKGMYKMCIDIEILVVMGFAVIIFYIVYKYMNI